MHKDLLTFNKPQSFESEQFKILRAKLASPCCILITSALMGEGKSFVSANLAASIAQTMDKYALLVDSDLRMPTLHHFFDVNLTPGLSNYLAGDIPLTETLRKTQIPKLTVLPGGEIPSNPAELLSSEKMAQLIDEIKTKYKDRYIIIESPPPLLMAEARVLSRHVDGVILVIAAGSTPRHLLNELVDAVGKEKIIGAVLNRSERHSLLSRYTRRRRKYYSGTK